MKKIILISTSIFLMTCCGDSGRKMLMTSLDKSDIDSIILIPHSPDDTIALPSIKLTDINIQKFTDDFNNSKYVGPCKYYAFYLLNVYLKDGNLRDFRCNGQNIKENNDQCFEIGEQGYFDKLYKND